MPLSFRSIDLNAHAELCIHFRRDAFVAERGFRTSCRFTLRAEIRRIGLSAHLVKQVQKDMRVFALKNGEIDVGRGLPVLTV